MCVMKKYRDKKSGMRVVEVQDLSFLSDRNHRYGWIRRHYFNLRHKRACRKADIIITPDDQTAFDVSRYYFIPKSRITIRHSQESPR